jgi:hypothetical protein
LQRQLKHSRLLGHGLHEVHAGAEVDCRECSKKRGGSGETEAQRGERIGTFNNGHWVEMAGTWDLRGNAHYGKNN